MATVKGAVTDISKDGSVKKVVWTPLTSANPTGDPISFAEWGDRSVQILGTFGGATVVWEGSNDGGATWKTLTDPQGNAISKTSADLEAVTELTELARPSSSGGGGTQSITVAAVLRRANSMRT